MEPESSLPHSQVPATCSILRQLYPVHTPSSHFLKIHLNIILPSKPVSPKWSLSLKFPHQNPVYASPLPHACFITGPSHSSWFHHPNNIWWTVHCREKLRKFSGLVDSSWTQIVLWAAWNGLLRASVFLWWERLWHRKSLRLYTHHKIFSSNLTCVHNHAVTSVICSQSQQPFQLLFKISLLSNYKDVVDANSKHLYYETSGSGWAASVGPRLLSLYSDPTLVGRSEDQIPVEASIPAPFQNLYLST